MVIVKARLVVMVGRAKSAARLAVKVKSVAMVGQAKSVAKLLVAGQAKLVFVLQEGRDFAQQGGFEPLDEE